MQTVISRSKLYAVLPIRFNADLMEHLVTAAMEVQEWSEVYHPARNSNPSANVEYLYAALDYNRRRWIPPKDDLCKIICEVEHDFMIAGHMGLDKKMEIIKRNVFWPGMDKYIKDFVRSCESCQCSKVLWHIRYGYFSHWSWPMYHGRVSPWTS
jgi:hypothetical protein